MSLAEKTPAVYSITNKINGKIYIGSTRNLTNRFKQYISAVKRYSEGSRDPAVSSLIVQDIVKYGWDNFEFKVEDASIYMQDPDLRSLKEVELIMKYRSILPEYGYNSTMGGETGASKHRKAFNRKPKALFVYDTEDDSIMLYLKGTSNVHEFIGGKRENVPDACQRGKLFKNRYFIFYANTERRHTFAEYIDAKRNVPKNNGGNDLDAQNKYQQYKHALAAVDEFAKELEL